MEVRSWRSTKTVSNLSPQFITIALLATVFVLFCYSILQGRFYLGSGDPSSRFLTAMDFAHNPRNALDLNAWLGVWPPVPFIIQGSILRCLLFLGLRETNPYIFAVQITGVVLLLLGIYSISRTVALQTDERTGLLAAVLCLSARTLLFFAPSSMAEVYTFFFISLAFWNLFRFVKGGKGLGWSIFLFVLAFFCRMESLVLAIAAGAYLLALRRWWSAVLLLGVTFAIVSLKFFGSLFLVNGAKFFQYSSLYGWSNPEESVKTAQALVSQLWFYNRPFILLSCLSLLPIAYHVLRRRDLWLISMETNNRKDELQLSSPKKGTLPRLAWFLDQIALGIVKSPVIFWIVVFISAMGILIEQALQGNINAQFRYLSDANVFMTVIVAVIVARSIKVIWAGRERFAKAAVFGSTTAIVVSSLWSGLSVATARRVPWSMPPAVKDVILYIRADSTRGDRVAFDFLLWQETPLQVELLDPTQPTKFESEPGLTELIPDKLQPPTMWIAYVHAFILEKHPKFLVIASPSLWEAIQERLRNEKDINSDIPVDQIRSYLSPVKGSTNQFIFQSPFIFPDRKVEYDKVYENESFIVMELKNTP